MKPIFVDEEVLAALQQRAVDPGAALNSVLRELLGLGGKLRGLLEEGLVHAGQQLVWNRAALRQRHTAVITDVGGLRLEDGRVYLSPSSACAALAEGRGKGFSGWDFWRTEDGMSLGQLRHQMQDRHPQEEEQGPGLLLPYVERGLLKAGQRLFWRRRDVTHTAKVTEEGRIRLASGREVSAPSAACTAVTGIAGRSGWEYWRTENGQRLKELRRELEEQGS